MMGQKVPMISTTEVTKVELEFTNESMDTLNLQREVTPHAAIWTWRTLLGLAPVFDACIAIPLKGLLETRYLWNYTRD